MANEGRARDVLRKLDDLRSERANFEPHWQEIGDIMRPMRADFAVDREPGQKRLAKVYDGTAILANENLAAGLWGAVTNSANKWFQIQSEHDELNRVHAVKLWNDATTKAMLTLFQANGAQFYSRAMELYPDLTGFGTAVFYADELTANRSVWFSSRSLHECFIDCNERDQVDTVYRVWRWTARQAVMKWGDRTPARVREAAEKNDRDKFTFVHAVEPRPAGGRDKLRKRHPFTSDYVCVESAELISEAGHDEFPYQVPRWSTLSRSPYGEGPGMYALPDTKMLNTMSRTTIEAAQRSVVPTLLAPDKGVLQSLKVTPGSVLYGAVDNQGRRLVHPLDTGANIPLGIELEERRRDQIREAFYASLLLMVERPDMTATEWLGRQEEKLRLMGPHIGRVQAEWLSPLIDRVFGIMVRGSLPFWQRNVDGWLPLPPPELMEAPGLRTEYVSPLARAQKAQDGAAVVRTLQAIAPMAEARPEILDNYDVDVMARVVGESNGLPTSMLVDPRQVEKIRQARQQQQQQQQQIEAAPQLAGALKDAMGAVGQMRGSRSAA
jgi:hypothetical protein